MYFFSPNLDFDEKKFGHPSGGTSYFADRRFGPPSKLFYGMESYRPRPLMLILISAVLSEKRKSECALRGHEGES